MKTTFAINIVLCVFLTLCSCTCCKDAYPEITYVVDGERAGRVTVFFHNEFGAEILYPSIALPWVKKFKVEFRDDEYYGGNYTGNIFPALIEAELPERTGRVWVKIYVNDELVAADTSGADFKAKVTYGVRL